MSLKSLGKIAVSSAGTPQAVSASQLLCQSISFQALSSNTGKIYIGTQGMSKSTLVGVLAVLAVPTANLLPGYSVSSIPIGSVNAAEIYLDADTSTEGVIVGYYAA